MNRICFILPKFAPESVGGAELQVFYLGKELLRRGYEVHYIREAEKGAPKEYQGIFLHAIPRVRWFFLGCLNAFHIHVLLRRIDPQLVYCRVSQSYMICASLGTRFKSFDLIWACSHVREVDHFKSRSKYLFTQLFERIEFRFWRQALKKAKCVFVQTEEQRQLLYQRDLLKSVVLKNAHPLPEWRVSLRENLVVWVANFRSFKRPELFIELARRARGLPLDFVMVGNLTTDEMQKSIETAEAELSNFKYLGSLSVDEVEQLLWRTRVFVNTSDEEGFPNTFIQALMRGVPIGSLNVDPNNMIRDNDLGVVDKSLDNLLIWIDKILSNETEWKATSDRCRSFSESNFSIARYTDAFVRSVNF